VDNLERAQQLYTAANQEPDPQRRAELYAEADYLLEDEEVYESEEVVDDDELAAQSDAGIDWTDLDDDDIDFEPAPELLEGINGEGELEN
jgi:hypothetical protein